MVLCGRDRWNRLNRSMRERPATCPYGHGVVSEVIAGVAAFAAILSAYWARQASRRTAVEQREDRDEGRRQFDEDQARLLYVDASGRLTRSTAEHEIALVALRQLRDDRKSGRYGPMAAQLITDQLGELTDTVEELLGLGQDVELRPTDEQA